MPIYQALLPQFFLIFHITTPLLEYGGHSLTSKARQAHFSLYFCLKMAQNQRLSRICKLACTRLARGDLGSPLRSTVGAGAPTSHKETLFAPHRKQQLRKTFQPSKNGKNAFILHFHLLMVCRKEIFCY